MGIIEIQEDNIRLGQLLKVANLVSTGGEAKALIQGGEVRVNGEIETRRGRQLKHLDLIELGGQELQIHYRKVKDE